jgi:hypothetical protein
MSEVAKSRGEGEGEEIEQGDGEGEGEADEVVGAHRLIARAQRLPVQKPSARFTRSRLIFETDADADTNANAVQALDSTPIGKSSGDSIDANYTHDRLSHPPSIPSLRLTNPDSNVHSILLPGDREEQDASCDFCNDDTLDRQRRRRVRFDEALRMHSYGGSQYVGRIVDRDVERKVVQLERNKVEEEDV